MEVFWFPKEREDGSGIGRCVCVCVVCVLCVCVVCVCVVCVCCVCVCVFCWRRGRGRVIKDQQLRRVILLFYYLGEVVFFLWGESKTH